MIYSAAGDDVGALLAALQAVAGRHFAALSNLTRDYFAARDSLEPIDEATLLEGLRDGELVLVDVRPAHEYAAGHIPGALSIPLATLEARLRELPRERTIVAYCRGPYCALAAEAVDRLRAGGFEARRTAATVSSLRPQLGVAR